jgi:GMP synthase PP-ATPase subunit
MFFNERIQRALIQDGIGNCKAACFASGNSIGRIAKDLVDEAFSARTQCTFVADNFVNKSDVQSLPGIKMLAGL